MYPFWDPVIAPLIAVSGAQRVVEVGALRGETTIRMLDDLGPQSELHVIDPVPAFDPGEHEQKFPGRYIFHRDLSLNVLGDLGAFDVALLDGDHNWYTVYNEMRLLAAGARAADRPMPLTILHDIGWPYGRRDLYYEPDNIPADMRQEFDYKGMRPGQSELLRRGGMNHTLANALTEGGPRNGVRTGMDDFIAEHDRPLRTVIIPIYFGLGIVVEEATLDEHPELRAALDRLESPEGTAELLELSENIRLGGVVFQQNVERMRFARIERAVNRHLDVLRSITGASDAEVTAADEAVAFVAARPELVGDIVYAGSTDGLRYLAASLEAHELDNRNVWAIGDDLAAAAADIGERVFAVDFGATTLPEAPIATLAVASDELMGKVETALRERLEADAVVLDKQRRSVR